ncbi:hypothetical protein M0802_013461 [Mischocyttarus mexicanus]|nr:hypothetical protein M0802_013462 [Mischocyttarus mexicanus]KAI4483370.1 hypothetical protein M0802_013461 [Mischocyttarus mexicanus]
MIPLFAGKLRQNSGNDILEGNQDMLKERDLKLRSRNKNGDVTDDYEDSSSTTKKSSVLLLIVTIILILCLNHRLPFRTLHPA